MYKRLSQAFSWLMIVAFALVALPVQNVQAISPDIVISQVYGGGGNAGATYTHDFIELFNRGTTTVSLAGWSVQYASATGTGNFGANSSQLTELPAVSLAPGQYLLIQEATNAAVGSPLPTPDVTDSSPINMGGSAGKVALVNSTASLGCNGGSAPCSAAQLALIKDMVGYGNANFFEGSGAAPTLSNSTAAFRANGGCVDTDNNSVDFAAGAPNPRNSASPLAPCTPKINEFSASTTGTDVEYVEIYGAPNADYSTYKVLEIEGDSGLAVGTVDEVISLGTIDANGFYLVNLPANTLENGTISLLLVKNFTGVLNTDLDTDNNGVFDATPWDAIVDSVAVNDGGAGDVTYGLPTLGVSYDGAPFAPGGASRIPDGVDTDATSDWVRNDFDLAGIPGFTGTPVAGEALNTPGAPNQAITVSSNIVTIEATDSDAAEAGSATGNFRISRTGSTTSALTVNYTISGNASAADYSPLLGGTADIPAGSLFVDILITPVDDADVEGPETLTLTLTAGIGYLLGAATSASVTIADNDVAVVITPISAIQGSGSNAVIGTFTVEAIVVGDYQTQGSGQLRGFFIQEEDADADADPATSEGIFVFCSSCLVPVSVGDKVRVTGASSEFFNMSQLTASTVSSVTVLSSGNPLPTPASVQLPVPGVPSDDLTAATAAINAYFEAFEGMLVTFPDTLSVSEYFELARYGQVILTEGGRPHNFTAVNTPTAAGFINHEINLASRTIILDDTDNRQNRPVDTPNTSYYHPVPGLSTTNYFRGGDTITNLTGVLHWSFAGQSGTDAWRIRPVTEAYSYAFMPVNTRPAVPSVDGHLKVASFNVLNYFLTIDTSDICAPTQNQDCRGADSAQELERQRTKMLAALSALDADVFGFMEMENTPGVQPLADIVGGLPGYAYIDTGVIGTDAIRVGIIYKTSTVQLIGNYAILDSSVDPRFIDTRNRPALAQTFEEIASGGRVTVVVNHLKSKGSGCGVGDDDTTTGQGNCNGTRTLAAQALADWLATDPTGSGDPDVLIIGDLNSYAKEDPIVALQNAGYVDLVTAFGGPSAYGYVFDGQLGYLDHALASSSLNSQVAGVAEWHINADEIPLFDYNDDVRTADEAAFEEESDTLPLYEPNEFRTSDHDPVIIGLNLNAPPTVSAGGPYDVNEGSSVTLSASGNDPNGNVLTYEWDLDNDGTFESPGQSVVFSAAALDGPSSYTVQVRVTDPGGLSAVSQATVNVLNANPTVAANPASQSVQYSDPIIDVAITGSDVSADIPLTLSTEWNVGGGAFAAGLPSWLTLSFVSCDTSSCSWTLSGIALTAPGTYVVRATMSDKDGGVSTTDTTLVVTQEDARTTYTGALFASTSSTSSSIADVTLAATVQDISVTSDAAGDTYPGDIRNATVTFVNRDNNAILCTAMVGLVDPNDQQTGAATCTWTVDLGSADSISYEVGIVVGGYYHRNSTSEDAVATISKPLASDFITGGGYIILAGSAGQLAGDDGSRANFGFNVKYNRSGKNLKGNVTIIVRRLESDGIVHVYQIKGNAMTSLAVQVNDGTAVFNGKANIQDVTDPLAPISIDGNATLQIVVDDNGDPGSGDTIGITLWNKDGGLWFSSKWDGIQTVQQNLDGGNLIVR